MKTLDEALAEVKAVKYENVIAGNSLDEKNLDDIIKMLVENPEMQKYMNRIVTLGALIGITGDAVGALRLVTRLGLTIGFDLARRMYSPSLSEDLLKPEGEKK